METRKHFFSFGLAIITNLSLWVKYVLFESIPSLVQKKIFGDKISFAVLGCSTQISFSKTLGFDVTPGKVMSMSLKMPE